MSSRAGPLGRYGNANLGVAAQVAGWAVLLTLIDDARIPWFVRACGGVAFCLMMQGVFTMLHEYCHGNAHRNPKLNYMIGWMTATIFSTAPTLFRVQHWGHHRRNRTEAERAEFIHEGERALWKTAKYYMAILGNLAGFVLVSSHCSTGAVPFFAMARAGGAL